MFSDKFKDLSRSALAPRYPEKYLTKLINDIKPKRILEIGTFNGIVTAFFAQFNEVEEVITIDIEDKRKRNWRVWENNKVESKIKYIIIKSDEDKRNVVNNLGNFDLIFIDGDHSYKGVKTDFEICKGKSPYILFHDFGTNPEVTRFINEQGNKIIHRKIDVGFALWKK